MFAKVDASGAGANSCQKTRGSADFSPGPWVS